MIDTQQRIHLTTDVCWSISLHLEGGTSNSKQLWKIRLMFFCTRTISWDNIFKPLTIRIPWTPVPQEVGKVIKSFHQHISSYIYHIGFFRLFCGHSWGKKLRAEHSDKQRIVKESEHNIHASLFIQNYFPSL